MKALAGIMLTFFLGAMFVSLFHMSMGMGMSGGMSDCPFMAHEEVVCSMNIIEHIGAWKSVFLAVAPIITLLLAAASVVAFVVSRAPHLFAPKQRYVPMPHRQLRERTYTFSYRPLQELFANGILHPKVF